MTPRYRTWILAVLWTAAIASRVLLCWYNPPVNAFDNHFVPIKLILATGHIPPADACIECYHPPVFYAVSALVARVCISLGMQPGPWWTEPNPVLMEPDPLSKALQFVNCFYGIAVVGVVFLILRKVKMSDQARLLAFGTVCLLPRHIYISALHVNDGMGILFVCVCAYLCLEIIDRGRSGIWTAALSGAVTVAIFIKHSGWAAVPMAATCWTLLDWCRGGKPTARTLLSFLALLLIPAVLFAGYLRKNVQEVGKPLPYNDQGSLNQPRDEHGVTYLDFKPWKFVKTPFVVPGQSGSFWTLLYSGMWFDTEPKFLFATDVNWPWWQNYGAWTRGEKAFPAETDPLSTHTHLLAALLLILGAIPLACALAGLWRAVVMGTEALTQPGADRGETAKFAMLTVLLLCNLAGIAVIVQRLPVFTSMKASFLLNSLPTLSVFVGLGITQFERYPRLARVVTVLFFVLFGLCALHVGQIVLGLRGLGI